MNVAFCLSFLTAFRLSSFLLASPSFRELESRATQETVKTCSKSGTAALTYDDGPYIYENEISDYLHARQIKGTFFVNGYNYDCIYDEEIVQKLRRTFAQGHLIGSHTWSHPNVSTLSVREIHQQLDLIETALKKILGIKPKFFRFPYGDHTERTVQIAKQRGYTVVDWSFESGDASGTPPEESKTLYQRLARTFPTPQIALNHETYETTARQVTPYAISVLQKAGYKLVHVSECLGMGTNLRDLYQWVGNPSPRDASWTCAGTPPPSPG